MRFHWLSFLAGVLVITVSLSVALVTTPEMRFHWLSLLAGIGIGGILAVLTIVIERETGKKRAREFSRRFALFSEALSSLKALLYRVAIKLKELREKYNEREVDPQYTIRLNRSVDALVSICESISQGAMPPTEEIALDAMKGRSSSAQDRALADGLRFRDTMRSLRALLEKNGLENFSSKTGESHQVVIVDPSTNPE